MIAGTRRDEVARILEEIAKDGLGHPRNLDAAIDAIATALDGQPIMKCTLKDEAFYLSGDDPQDAIESFGDGVEVEPGFFVGSCDA